MCTHPPTQSSPLSKSRSFGQITGITWYIWNNLCCLVILHLPSNTLTFLIAGIRVCICIFCGKCVCVYVCVIMYSMKYDAIPGTEPFSSQEASGRITVKQAVPLWLKFAVISCTKLLLSTKRMFSLYIYFSRDGILSVLLLYVVSPTRPPSSSLSTLQVFLMTMNLFPSVLYVSGVKIIAVIFQQCCERGWELSPLTCVLICWTFIFAGDIFFTSVDFIDLCWEGEEPIKIKQNCSPEILKCWTLT